MPQQRPQLCSRQGFLKCPDLPSVSNPDTPTLQASSLPRYKASRSQEAGRGWGRQAGEGHSPLPPTPVPASAEIGNTEATPTCPGDTLPHVSGFNTSLRCPNSGMFPSSRQCHLHKDPLEVFLLNQLQGNNAVSPKEQECLLSLGQQSIQQTISVP